MSDSTVYEAYIGSNGILDFIADYQNLAIDYRTFENLSLTIYQEVTEIANETYLLYYYTEANLDCIALEKPLLTWAYTKSVGDIYLLDSEKVTDELPVELEILGSSLLMIIVMSNGEYTGGVLH